MNLNTFLHLVPCLILSLLWPVQQVSGVSDDWLTQVFRWQKDRGYPRESNAAYRPETRTNFEDTRDYGSQQLSEYNQGVNKRFSFGGLICCNHPPTRAPVTVPMPIPKRMRGGGQTVQERNQYGDVPSGGYNYPFAYDNRRTPPSRRPGNVYGSHNVYRRGDVIASPDGISGIGVYV